MLLNQTRGVVYVCVCVRESNVIALDRTCCIVTRFYSWQQR